MQEVPDSIVNAVVNLQRIFSIVLALSIAESFKQFIADRSSDDKKEPIHWDRLVALFAFLVLVIPFFHGMGGYFFNTYQVFPVPENYSIHLMIDTVAFTIEGALFFYMCRSLQLTSWRRFNCAALCILFVDIVWGVIGWQWHAPDILPWLVVNTIAFPVLGFFIFWYWKTEWWGALACAFVLFLRTFFDYMATWNFYFPPG